MPRILKNIDARIEAVRGKQREKSNATKKVVDTVKEVTTYLKAPNFGEIGVGEGMAFVVPEGTPAKSFLAKARGKLVAATREGQEWAGRTYTTLIGEHEGKVELIVKRVEDGVPKGVKRGGRPVGSKNKPKTAETIPGIAAAKAHLSGNAAGSETPPAPTQAAPDKETKVDEATPAKRGGRKPAGNAADTKVKDLTAK